MFGWFGAVVREGRAGLYSAQMDRSFRWGMSWFIFSEVMFFGALFAGSQPLPTYPQNLTLPVLPQPDVDWCVDATRDLFSAP